MIKLFLIGATGRMGQALQDVVGAQKNFKIVGGVGKTARGAKTIFSNSFPIKAPALDVVVDFSAVEVFDDTLRWCVKNKVAVVSGVTGISEAQQKTLKAAAKSIPVLWAPNMSIGVALVKKMLNEMQIPDNFDVHLLEYHHRHKKDAPSGTAKDLEGVLKKKTKNYAGTSAIRGGGIFGVHRVDLMADSEVISIQHQALDRHVFAKGALAAAEWLKGKKAGLYTLQDYLAAQK
ncbi:MAG: 4-hydroxy-tetrahydrodipicolinate reductase [Bdellovibrionaceae bacterium]|nr:4-hydroxy-tetrahydrodipicolinate reductase [Pseudobdellovibrionaceae bacterium]